ncbi:MAG TPA: EamA family transporter [Mycobacteriales bacterium]|nr:EamA family transporter [Mycobacteriales bacterium]
MPALLALLSSLLWGTADFLGGTLTRRLPAVVVVLASQAVALTCLVPLVLLAGSDLRPVLAPGAAAGLVGALALLAFYRALALGTMGVVAPVAALGVAVPVVAGLVAGEQPSAAQLAGIAVATVGVVLASGPELSGAGRGGAQPLVLALLAAAGFGAVFVLLAAGASSDGGGPAEVVGTLLVMRATSVGLLLVVVLLAVAGRGGRRPARGDLVPLGVVGVFDVAANGTYALATQGGLVSVSAVLASLYPAVTAVLAWRLHGERLGRLQRGGVVLALTGVVLLAAG